eukprot:gene30074-39935_t
MLCHCFPPKTAILRTSTSKGERYGQKYFNCPDKVNPCKLFYWVGSSMPISLTANETVCSKAVSSPSTAHRSSINSSNDTKNPKVDNNTNPQLPRPAIYSTSFLSESNPSSHISNSISVRANIFSIDTDHGGNDNSLIPKYRVWYSMMSPFNLKLREFYVSLPYYHGWFVAISAVAPALLFMLIWQSISPALVTNMVLSAPVAAELPQDTFARAAILSEARAIAQGFQTTAFQDMSDKLVPLYKGALSYYKWLGVAATLLLFFAGGAYAFTRLKPDFRARSKVERVIMFGLLVASLIAIITTLGIFASLIFESWRFFSMVSPFEFLFGTDWNPKSDVTPGADNGYGAIPLFWGTIFIGAIIAMIVAI